MSKNTKFAVQVISVLAGCVIIVYLVSAYIVGLVNAGKMSDWCEYKNGDAYSTKSKDTGKRWSPNPATTGLTGECINPGDKGL